MPLVSNVPKLAADGKLQLDALLKATDDSRKLPAMYWGATTIDGPIYFNCAGDKNYFNPAEGKVTEDTCETSIGRQGRQDANRVQ
jgi:hypothetical protein